MSYFENASMVVRYWSCRFVDHAGESRSIEPVSGNDKSILHESQCQDLFKNKRAYIV